MADTLSRKRIVQKTPHSLGYIHSRYKQAPIVQFCANRVMVVTYMCARGHAYSRSAWAENIANAWLPYTNMENTLGGISLIRRCQSKIRNDHFSMLVLFCVPIQSSWSQVLPRAPTIILDFFLFFFKLQPHTKIKEFILHTL